MNKLSTAQLAQGAEEIRIGEVVSTWVSPDPDNKMFYTFVKVRVQKTIKGKEVSEILLKQPGGLWTNPETGGQLRQQVFGMTSFKKGEKALMFITHSKDGAPTVTFQGKREIINKDGQELAVEESNEEVEYANKKHSEHREKSLYSVRETQALDSVIAEIQRAVNEKKGDLNR